MVVSEVTQMTLPGSQKLYAEIIETLPAVPVRCDLTFYADDIKFNLYHPHPKKEQYIQECERGGILPFTELTFQYDYDHKMLLPYFSYDNDAVICHFRNLQPYLMKARSSLLSGGRINRIDISVPECEEIAIAKDAFSDVRNMTEELLFGGYTIHDSKISLSGYFNKEDAYILLNPAMPCEIAQLNLPDLPDSIDLPLPDRASRTVLIHWFEGLGKNLP